MLSKCAPSVGIPLRSRLGSALVRRGALARGPSPSSDSQTPRAGAQTAYFVIHLDPQRLPPVHRGRRGIRRDGMRLCVTPGW